MHDVSFIDGFYEDNIEILIILRIEFIGKSYADSEIKEIS